jgi:hypothetical protein
LILIISGSVFFSFVLFPLFEGLKIWELEFIQIIKQNYIGLVSGLIFIVIFCWRQFCAILKKYCRSCGLERSLFNWIDGTVLFLLWSFFFIYYVQVKKVSIISVGFLIFVVLNIVILFIRFIVFSFLKRRQKSKPEDTEKQFPLSDEPIQESAHDLLNRGTAVYNLYKEIKVFRLRVPLFLVFMESGVKVRPHL